VNPAARGLVAAACASAALSASAAGLSVSNYVDIGDAIVDMLDTSPLAFSTMLLGLNAAPQAVRASLTAPPARWQAFSTPCPGGGSISGSVADRDASGDLSVQDRFTTVFNSCRIDDQVIGGSSEFVVSAHRIDGALETVELEFLFHRFGTEAMRWTGRAHASLQTDARSGSEQYAVTYRDLAVTRGAHAYRWNFRLETHRPPLGDHTMEINGSLTAEQEALRLAQNDAFVGAPGRPPRSGLLTATDTDGDRLEVEAGAQRYRYRFYARHNAGDLPDSSSLSKPHQSR